MEHTTGIHSGKTFDINYRKNLENPRICICDDYSISKSCVNECDVRTKTKCNYHTNLKCSIPNCKKKFHKGCIASHKYMHIDEINSDTLQCMKCESEQDRQNVKWNQLKHTEVAEKLERVGIICPSNQQERQKSVRQMNKMVEVLK